MYEYSIYLFIYFFAYSFFLAPKKLYDNRIYQLALVANNQLLVLLSGKERIIRIKLLQCLLERSEWTFDSEIVETKNATLFAVNPISLTLCVAVKNRLLIYKIHSNPRPYPYTLKHELNTTQNITYLDISTLKINNNEEKILWYGYSSTFIAQRLDQQCPSVTLLRDEDPTLKVLRERSIDILRVIPITSIF